MKPEKADLQPTPIINFTHESVREFTAKNTGNSQNKIDRAIRLYYAVRDDIRYNPYTFDLTVKGLKASTTLKAGEGWCVPKAALLAACCRSIGIPARLGYADVRNHLSTARMRERMQTDIFHWHGYTSLYLDGKWVKSTPAFNIELCERFRFKPLEFNGRDDSIYHPFDLEGNKHMEYLRDRGEFNDVPLEKITGTFRKAYEHKSSPDTPADFDADVARETGNLKK